MKSSIKQVLLRELMRIRRHPRYVIILTLGIVFTFTFFATMTRNGQPQKLPIAASTKSQGDVFFCWGGGSAKPYVDSGAVLKLDEYLEKYNVREDLLDGTLTYGTYDGGVYGLPLKQWAGVLFCNQELFDQYNVKIPAT